MDIKQETITRAAKGVDMRTIWLHFEAVLGRALSEEEAAAMRDGWRESGPAREEVAKRRAAGVAAEARKLRRRP